MQARVRVGGNEGITACARVQVKTHTSVCGGWVTRKHLQYRRARAQVNNTDAEGRLTLADALWYAQEKCGVQAVVDIATLTGACVVALGGAVAGLFTPNEAIAASLKAASQAAGAPLPALPLCGTSAVCVSPVVDGHVYAQ